MNKIPVVFFGSGPVAAKSLENMLPDFEIVAVVTKPKPAHHRGDFPVINVAENNNLPLYRVTNKQELTELIGTKPFKSEVAILIDFGIIVSQEVIDYFPKGIINSHFSLLPEWRGADPITFAILSGQKQTGVSLMLLVEAMDEGPVVSVGIHELDGTETTPMLTDSLIDLSNSLLIDQVPRYLADDKKGVAQSELPKQIPNYPSEPSYSRKLTKDDGILDFSKSAEVLEREIRAFIEWPKSKTKLTDIDVIITSASVINNSGKPGEFDIDGNRLVIYCGEKALQVNKLKPAGKPEMSAEAFIAGYKSRLT